MNGTILLAEDEALARNNIRRLLQDAGYQVHEVSDGFKALTALETNDFDLVLTDLQMPGADGVTVLRHVRAIAPQTLPMIMTAFASVDSAVEALHLGVHGYVLKPIDLEELLWKVRILFETRDQAWELQHLRRAVTRAADAAELLIGNSQAMRDLRALIAKVAETSATTLITGERGSGKKSSPAHSTCKVHGHARSSCRSIARRFPSRWWKVNSLAISKTRSPERSRTTRACFNEPAAGLSFSMKLGNSPFHCK